MQSLPSNNSPVIDQMIRAALVIALVFWSYLLIQPFFGFLAWSIILAIALHPAYVWVNKRIGHRPILTATLFILVGIAIILGTLSVLTHNLLSSVTNLKSHLDAGGTMLPRLPESIEQLPWLGEKIRYTWESISLNLSSFIKEYADVIIRMSKSFLSILAHKTLGLLIFILSMILSGYLLVHSDNIVAAITSLMHRISPKRGATLMMLMQETVQNVSIGVIGVALFQSVIFGLLLLFIGVPAVGFLTFLALVLSIAQLGLALLIIPIAIWIFTTYGIVAACIYTTLLILTGLVDNFIKPFVLSHGLRTPMSMIFIGVIGGLLLHGFIGIFIGPVILALFYDLFNSWVIESPHSIDPKTTQPLIK